VRLALWLGESLSLTILWLGNENCLFNFGVHLNVGFQDCRRQTPVTATARNQPFLDIAGVQK
jgi:hypothetical protein